MLGPWLRRLGLGVPPPTSFPLELLDIWSAIAAAQSKASQILDECNGEEFSSESRATLNELISAIDKLTLQMLGV